MDISASNLTIDRFLDGDLNVRQPKIGYRAGTDPVFLAASVPASTGETVLELGCGVGVASLCLGRRVSGLIQTGVEFQPGYAELAVQNAKDNELKLEIIAADIANLPPEVTSRTFDHVIANPPYFSKGDGSPAGDPGKEAAFREQTPLSVWIDVALKRLKPGGYLSVVYLSERLPDLLAYLAGRAGGIKVKPLTGRPGKPAGRIILRARKGGRGAFCLCDPLILHDGRHHEADRDSYSQTARSILRGGKALTF